VNVEGSDMDNPIAYIQFTDGIERPAWHFDGRQYVIDDNGQSVYGVSHCRGPGPHVRGCWVLDQILGKG
jgi:hypothetical protein